MIDTAAGPPTAPPVARPPGYDLDATRTVGGEAVHRALGDARRRRILSLLSERSATARQLAAAIERSTPTTIHHLDVLADAGLVQVVRTEPVRATTQRWWGRTARVFILEGPSSPEGSSSMLDEAMAEARAAAQLDPDKGMRSTVRYARIPEERAEEWFERLCALADEFTDQPRAGDVVHGMVVGMFRTAWRPLPGDSPIDDTIPEDRP